LNIGLDAALASLMERFSQKGITLYVVGGYVRDSLLESSAGVKLHKKRTRETTFREEATRDVDVCAAAPPDVLAGLQIEGVTIAEKSYGMGTLSLTQHWNGQTYSYEYTAFRADHYRQGGAHRPDGVTFTDRMEVDAARRDFTVNALYAGQDGLVLDPTGRGLSDLAQQTIAQVLDETLSQDALRILRMVRFACALGFAIDPATWRTARANVRHLANISAERIRDELFLILLGDVTYGRKDAVLRALRMLRDLGALGYILPELLEGAGFEQKKQYHAYDVLDHNLHACAAAPPDLVTRLAALLHDIAKPSAYARDGNMYAHGDDGADMAAAALARLRAGNELAANVSQLVRYHMFDLDNRAKERAVIRLITKLGKERFLRLCDLREADFIGSGRGMKADSAHKWRTILRKLEEAGAPLHKKQLAVNGNDIMQELSIGPGKRVGDILSALHIIALKKPSQNTYQSLIRYAKIIDAHYDRKQEPGHRRTGGK